MPTWLTEFHAFTIGHAVILLIATAAISASCYHGRLHRETPREVRFRRTWGWLVLVTQAVSIGYWTLPARFDIQVSLPLQLCDLAGIVAGLAMLFRPRVFHTLLYFWGLALSTQAFVSPILHIDEGPNTLRFWLYWLTHLQIIGSAVYDLVVGGYRPAWRDYLAAFGITIAYAALATAVNLSFDTNYGYIGNKLPTAGTALDFLPPWPYRPFALGLGAAVWMALFWLIWPIARLLPPRRFPRGHCQACGYDRAGLTTSAPCPECGAATAIKR